MSSPIISVLIPTYNVESYVVESLESVRRQTFENFEAIVIDDGSEDGTYNLARAKFASDARFKFFRNNTNSGIAATLNKALSLASGKFIARADGDDVMVQDRLERQMAFLTQNPHVGLVGTSFITIDETGREIGRGVKACGVERIRRILPWGSPVSHIWLARRHVYDLVGGYRMPTVEDYDFLLRADLAGVLFDNVPNYFGMKVRIRGGNTATTQGLIQAKLHNYALHQYMLCRKGRSSNYDEAFVRKIIQSNGGFWKSGHALSAKIAQKAVKKKGASWVALTLLSGLVSPYRAQYLARSFMKQRIAKQADMGG